MHDPNKQDLDELFRQIDDLLEDSGEIIQPEPDGIDLAEFTPQGTQIEEPMIYQNYSNGYGSQIRNAANNYGQPVQEQPAPRPRPKPKRIIPAYNADFRREQLQELEQRQAEYRDYGVTQEEAMTQAEKAQKKHKKSKGRGRGCCGCLVVPVAVLLALVLAFSMMITPPLTENDGERKKDTATILLCGTDKDGTRTDTMMLLYLSGSESKVGLLSLPRDTLTKTSSGKNAKLNSAYGRNGCGEEGMEVLLDYIQRLIGYRPDGYVLVDMNLVPQVVDLMGGLDFDVPQDMEVSDVAISAGYQHLSGQQVMTLLRFRKGYYNADLGRVQMQRAVIQACIDQWLTAEKLSLLPQALELVMEGSLTNLTTSNFMWVGKTVLTGMGNLYNDTLPGYADYVGSASYYILKPEEVAQMITDRYYPFIGEITTDDLTIAG